MLGLKLNHISKRGPMSIFYGIYCTHWSQFSAAWRNGHHFAEWHFQIHAKLCKIKAHWLDDVSNNVTRKLSCCFMPMLIDSIYIAHYYPMNSLAHHLQSWSSEEILSLTLPWCSRRYIMGLHVEPQVWNWFKYWNHYKFVNLNFYFYSKKTK